MSRPGDLCSLLERFFTKRLMQQREASPHTVASYRDSFRLLLRFANQHLKIPPSDLQLRHLDADLIDEFLEDVERDRAVGARTRNLRLTAIRSFFRFVAFEEPAYAAQIQRVLAIPSKKWARPMVSFLSHAEVLAILSVPDKKTWYGRRDHALLHLAIQTGLRLSELMTLTRQSFSLSTGPHVRCHGKGRKERCTPLTRPTAVLMKAWLKEIPDRGDQAVFPSVRGGQLSSDAVQYLVAKHIEVARSRCPSLRHKQISPHVLRHTAAMELLQANVDTSTIALWLGHESVDTTQIYLHAHLALKEAALARLSPVSAKRKRFRPNDRLLEFLNGL